MPYLGNVTFTYPIDWVDAKRPIGGSNYTSISGRITTQKVLDSGVVNGPITLSLSWINHTQYELLYTYYNSVATYALEMIGGGPVYTVAFQTGPEAFAFTPVVPEVPYTYRSLSAQALSGSYYNGTIKLICLGVTGGG